jgi:hypothetical protein
MNEARKVRFHHDVCLRPSRGMAWPEGEAASSFATMPPKDEGGTSPSLMS